MLATRSHGGCIALVGERAPGELAQVVHAFINRHRWGGTLRALHERRRELRGIDVVHTCSAKNAFHQLLVALRAERYRSRGIGRWDVANEVFLCNGDRLFAKEEVAEGLGFGRAARDL